MDRIPSFDPLAPKSPWMSFLSWSARQRPVTWFLVNVGNHIDPVLMRATGGRVKSTLNAPTVLLTHTGAKSGQKRSTPLGYFTGLAMPDIWAGVAILAAAIMSSCYRQLSGFERIGLLACLSYACLSHATHILIVANMALAANLESSEDQRPTVKILSRGIQLA